MGQDHHIHTKSDPKSLKEAEQMYGSFIIWSRNILIILTVLLAFMAATLV
jgi:hypothetical protein